MLGILLRECVTLFLLLGFHSFQCEGRKNVLFLMADDLRPELGAYLGQDYPSPVHPHMWTPHLDALASRSLLLKRAYVQQALCNPSRASLLTGRRPDSTRVYELQNFFRDNGAIFTTLPQHFKNNGYTTIGAGKVFHKGAYVSTRFDDALSWSEEYEYFHGDPNFEDDNNSWRAVPDQLLVDKPLRDEQIATRAISTLRSLSDSAKQNITNFFLAVGFHKPHLPFVFPESVLQHYPETDIELPPNPLPPKDMPNVAFHPLGAMKRYRDIGAITQLTNSTVVKALRRAYYSSVTFMDIQVGRVVDELERLGLADNTIVSFCGDHGWQLGEHGEWLKHTNFELATHAPMMIRVPGLTDAGIESRQLVEFVDMYPTLVEAAGLQPLPPCPVESRQVELCREGTSLIPLIAKPNVPLKAAAFSQFPRKQLKIMGYTMRTDQFRYTEWARFTQEPSYKPDWNRVSGIELYDHFVDPGENFSQAHNSSYLATIRSLSTALHRGWRAASFDATTTALKHYLQSSLKTHWHYQMH